jgi:hypothetical protein
LAIPLPGRKRRRIQVLSPRILEYSSIPGMGVSRNEKDFLLCQNTEKTLARKDGIYSWLALPGGTGDVIIERVDDWEIRMLTRNIYRMVTYEGISLCRFS